ncbi:MAG: NfeD family protein [Planctomycetota bacterium]|jgi:membrane protein implicated in regulation of membrane protease activity
MNPQDPTTQSSSSNNLWQDFFEFLTADSLADFMSWEFWTMVTIVLLAGEILTAGFLLGALTPGSVLAAIVAAFGLNMELQLTAFVLGTLAGLLYLRPLFLKKALDNSTPSNIDALVGVVAEVTESISATATGSVKVISEEWRARGTGEFTVGSRVRVLSVEGNTLIVGPSE